jgi:hypothetical protein
VGTGGIDHIILGLRLGWGLRSRTMAAESLSGVLPTGNGGRDSLTGRPHPNTIAQTVGNIGGQVTTGIGQTITSGILSGSPVAAAGKVVSGYVAKAVKDIIKPKPKKTIKKNYGARPKGISTNYGSPFRPTNLAETVGITINGNTMYGGSYTGKYAYEDD